ncbi:MAG: hypothetical protein H7Y03_07840 [Chitinophagaceae bacterium]|nr:hypothetical protein [Chitinophagaceae bacterium]
MKKIILSLAVFFTATTLVSAQDGAFEKGDKLLNLGVGVGTYYGPESAVSLGGSFEVGVADYISVGGQLDIYSNKYFGYRYTYIPVAGRASYHFGKHFLTVDNLDLYAGAALGFYFYGDDDDFDRSIDDDGGVFVGVFAGARYYFKPNFGVFGELGANTAALKLGVAFKF